MTKKLKIADLPEFDMAEHLPDEQAIAEYLTVVLEEEDPAAEPLLPTGAPDTPAMCGARKRCGHYVRYYKRGRKRRLQGHLFESAWHPQIR